MYMHNILCMYSDYSVNGTLCKSLLLSFPSESCMCNIMSYVAVGIFNLIIAKCYSMQVLTHKLTVQYMQECVVVVLASIKHIILYYTVHV